MKKLMILLISVLLLSQIAMADIIMDESYKPGDNIEFYLIYSDPLSNVEFSIIGPGEYFVIRNLLININSSTWGSNYSLSSLLMNGTYVMSIIAFQGTEIINSSIPRFEFNKSFDVIAWNINASLNKYYFKADEIVNLEVLITDKYSENLRFDGFYSLKNSQNIEIEKNNISLTEVNNGFMDSYRIPQNYVPGTSVIAIYLTDSEKRNGTAKLNFYVENEFYNETSDDNNTQDYSYIIWYFAIGVVVIIIILTFLRHRKIKKKEEEKRKKIEEKAKKVDIEPEEEYRTEYY